MPNEIKIKITSASDANGFKEVNKELKDTSTVAQIAERDVDKLDDSIADAGRSASVTRDQIAKLDRSITTSTESLRLMASALADTDDAAQRIDIKKAMSKVQADLNTSLKAKKILDVGDMIETNPGPVFKGRLHTDLVKSIGETGAGVATSVGPKVGLAIGGAIGTVVVSTLGTIIAAGAGTGVIGAGIALAAKNDPKIVEAAQVIGNRFTDTLGKSATKSFKKPIMESLELLEGASDRTARKMGGAFKELAPSIVPLTESLITAAERVGDSLINAATNGGPALDALGDSVVLLSDGFGDFIDTVVDGSPQAADNLVIISGALADLIRVGGEVVNFFSSASEYVIPFFGPIRDHYRGIADESKKVGKNQRDLAADMTVAAEAANGERDALLDLSNALKAQTDPVFGLMDAQDRLKKSQEAYEEAVKKGKKGTDEADQALRDMAKASIELEGKVGQLGDEFDGKVTPALKATLLAAGWTEDEIYALGKQFQGAKRDGDKFAKDYTAHAKVAGATGAHRTLRTLAEEARAFEGTWTATMITNYKTYGKPGMPMGGYGGRAHGGITGAADGHTSGGLTWVGERGAELVSLPAGSRVHTAGDSQRMAQGGSGVGELIVRAAPSANQDLMSILVESLQFYVRTHAGGSVQQAFGRPGVRA